MQSFFFIATLVSGGSRKYLSEGEDFLCVCENMNSLSMSARDKP